MKASMESRYKAAAVLWAIAGIFFLAGAAAMFIMRDDMPQIPRADIAYIGFLVVGVLFVAIAIATQVISKDKAAMIQDSDERAKIISGKAGILAFTIQTVLMSTTLFLLCFMGYASAPVMLTLMCTIGASALVYFITTLWYERKM